MCNKLFGKHSYIKIGKNGKENKREISLTLYIRHQIHHPENTKNTKYTEKQLTDSINAMREFLQIENI